MSINHAGLRIDYYVLGLLMILRLYHSLYPTACV